MIDLGLEGARAIVFGAGFIPERAGHGRASALQLAAAGATVACVDKDRERAEAIVQEVTAAGGKAFAVVSDATVESDIENAVARAVETLGGVDVAVNIVGEALWSKTIETTNDDWQQAIHANVTQVFYTFKAVIPYLQRQGTGGSLVALASVDGIQASRFHAAYGVAKAGVISLVKSLADEHGHEGIRVNAVAPGNVGGGNWDSPDVPFGGDHVNPLAPPRAKDIANGVLFLSSKLSERVTGQTLIIDGGALVQSRWGIKEDQLEAFR